MAYVINAGKMENNPYPERIYYGNSIVIGKLPMNIDLNQLLNYLEDIDIWKLCGKRIIIDFLNPHMKAVILTFDDEKSAHECNLRLQTKCCNFTIYDGDALFNHCRQLDFVCDIRSKNVYISGIDCHKTQYMYQDIFGMFGAIMYFEFCMDGEIPNARVEFSRATSAFAAVLTLQGMFDRNTIINLEIPLFHVSPIGSIDHIRVTPTIKLSLLNSPSTNMQSEKACTSYTTNVYRHNHMQNAATPSDVPEEYRMEAVFFEISRKLFGEKMNASKIADEYFEQNVQEHIKNFLLATKNKFISFNNIWNDLNMKSIK